MRSSETKPYRMPQPHVGQIVLWYEAGVRNDQRACPAIVKVVSQSSLHLFVFGIDRTFDADCVRHLNDPLAREGERIDQGGWDFTLGPISKLPEEVA